MNLRFYFRTLKTTAVLLLIWPMDINASNVKVIIEKCSHIFIFTNYIFYLIANFLLFYQAMDFFSILSIWLQFVFVLDALCLMTICRLQRSRLQVRLNFRQYFIMTSLNLNLKKFKYTSV